MADECDLAQVMSERYLRGEIAKARTAATSYESRVTSYECADCGREIPEARREAVPGCVRCVKCQIIFERGCG